MLRKEDLLELLKNKIEDIDFKTLLDNYLKGYFNNYLIYKHVATTEEFISWSNKLCVDYSGKIEPFASNEELRKFIKEEDFVYGHVLDNLHNGQKVASYCSGHGWNYPTVKDDLEYYFNEVVYEEYDKFLKENEKDVKKAFDIVFSGDEIEDGIQDYLSNTELEDYMVWESGTILNEYVENLTNEDILNMIK